MRYTAVLIFVGMAIPSILVSQVRYAVEQGDVKGAAAVVVQYRNQNGQTPEALESLSWVARGDLNSGNLDSAYEKAEEVKRLCLEALHNRRLDDEAHLPIALGAAYEVEAGVLNARHQRAEAVALLNDALQRWQGSSITARLQKNLNLLTLVGKAAPALSQTEWIGSKPLAAAELRGKVTLLFFWAHWCADCKGDAPMVADVARSYASRGLLVIAPTKRYGYTPTNDGPSPNEERSYIDRVYQRFYAQIPNAGVPLDGESFDRFGASTTPTIVVVDRHGIVKLYHPGAMSENELAAAVEPLLSAR